MSNESKNKTPTRPGTALTPVDSDRGSLQLKRAGMTLHDVQVCSGFSVNDSLESLDAFLYVHSVEVAD